MTCHYHKEHPTQEPCSFCKGDWVLGRGILFTKDIGEEWEAVHKAIIAELVKLAIAKTILSLTGEAEGGKEAKWKPLAAMQTGGTVSPPTGVTISAQGVEISGTLVDQGVDELTVRIQNVMLQTGAPLVPLYNALVKVQLLAYIPTGGGPEDYDLGPAVVRHSNGPRFVRTAANVRLITLNENTEFTFAPQPKAVPQTCTECKGTGTYTPLLGPVEKCRTCGGDGAT